MKDRTPEVRLRLIENEKLKVLQEVIAGQRTQVSAAQALGITDRWVRKLLLRMSRHGAAGLAHGNRGRTPTNRIPEELRDRILEFYRDPYEDFNLTHFREMLLEREHLPAPGRESLRQILKKAGLWQRSRAYPKHRQRRPRREYEGELLQMDASFHRWVGPEGPVWALVGAIDDATGDVPGARFFPAETREAYFTVLGIILERKGIPGAVYTDRDSVFVVNTAKDREIRLTRGILPRTQFGRALRELGIEWIPAYSPQAKGRIERLWGTLQDRLAKELGLAGVQRIEEANRYLEQHFLPRFRQKFRRPAAHPDPVYRPSPSRPLRNSILCWKEPRTLALDHTFQLEGQVFQVLKHEKVMALAKRQVEVRRTLQGRTEAWYRGIRLSIRPVEMPPPRAPRLARGAAPAAPGAAPLIDYRARGKVRI